MGKIEVYFKNLKVADDKSYYHEFIVWTPDNGPPQFIRGRPKSNGDLGSGSGGGSGSSGIAVMKEGPNVPFGAIVVKSDFYDPVHAQDWAKPGVDPSQIITTGSDEQLSTYWQKMLAEKDVINKANISYAAAGPNSNTVVTSLLQAGGLPLPKNNGFDGATPAPGADMSLLGPHYSAGHGYDELAANAGARGLRDVEYGIGAAMSGIGDDVGGAIREFRKALKSVAGTGSAGKRGMGLYDVAMAAGRPGLGGFAPVAGVAGRPMSQKSRAVAPVGEPGFVAAGQSGSADAGVLAARQGGGAETSCRAIVAQARHEAAAGRARREADAAALYLPARGTALAGLSFAPPAGGGAAGGSLLHPAVPGSAGAPGLRRRDSVHDAVSAAEAASADGGEAESQEFMAGAVPAPAGVAPADIERAVESYFFRQSRLPPVGGAGFNPLLSPVWAGLKIPG